MTGVKIDQWRGNIGLFNRQKVYKMCHGGLNNHDDNFLITDHFFFMVHWLPILFTIIPNLILLFFLCYECALIPHSTFIVCLLLLLRALSFSILFFQCDKLIFYSVFAFLKIISLPKKLFHVRKCLQSFFKYNISQRTKNLTFLLWFCQSF